ncbi:SLAM family member 5-like isoform X3 [Pimephales promelas]|uniref:SLAM family member 5-like isoform X2 n=1 Tax=Pimephales promelas TaxID=90988 RepID=UPI001955E7F2|nr:SLAM family member 5-like isoform X2 [Pimephales promelas]XP_039538612.1 SLAM family member 5-like isoform X3 [Pimephales promelas]
MFHVFVLFSLCFCRLIGVFAAETNKIQSVSVMEGDSVTLHTDLTEIYKENILWKYRAEKYIIAEILKKYGFFYTYDDVPDGRFRDRLKLDNQTGSLTITHTTTEHTGVYTLEINGVNLTSKTFNVSVYARLPVPVIIRNSSHCSSNCSVVCSSSVLSVCDATLSWYAGMSVLSSISVCDLSISLSLPLEVEYQDKNTYSCVLNNPISNQTTHLDINTLCRHTCAGPPVLRSLIVLISAGSLMIIVAVWIFCICKKQRLKHQEETTCDVEITYADTISNRGNAHKSKLKEENHVVYAQVAKRKPKSSEEPALFDP